jgi:hypothetical protein
VFLEEEKNREINKSQDEIYMIWVRKKSKFHDAISLGRNFHEALKGQPKECKGGSMMDPPLRGRKNAN